eukprot:TRINITY_DN9253_c0_g1_i1.p1 TRINITY_DN9253_c0_g1~~TRINITY_DN9253_c0_g1_i1.p1  ORF type:complete len:104 (-),score=12.30 TRINITY_DN9253_c0_g1_i1:45-356(-)
MNTNDYANGDLGKDIEFSFDNATAIQCELPTPETNSCLGLNFPLKQDDYPELFDFSSYSPLDSNSPIIALHDDVFTYKHADECVFSHIPVSYTHLTLPTNREV